MKKDMVFVVLWVIGWSCFIGFLLAVNESLRS